MFCGSGKTRHVVRVLGTTGQASPLAVAMAFHRRGHAGSAVAAHIFAGARINHRSAVSDSVGVSYKASIEDAEVEERLGPR